MTFKNTSVKDSEIAWLATAFLEDPDPEEHLWERVDPESLLMTIPGKVALSAIADGNRDWDRNFPKSSIRDGIGGGLVVEALALHLIWSADHPYLRKYLRVIAKTPGKS